MKKLWPALLALTLGLTSCNNAQEVVSAFDITVGTNAVTLTTEFNSDFALDLNGVFDIKVKGVDYGDIFLLGSTEQTPFTIGATADLSVFLPENWDGFAPTNKLPNGDPLPGWIVPQELVEVDIPINNPQFDVTAYVGYRSPYYLGVAVTLNFLDDNFPEGLSISQYFRKAGTIWSEVIAYGPVKDENGNILKHGGLFFAATIDPFLPALSLDRELVRGEWQATGKHADRYNNDPKELRKLLKHVKEGVEQFNEHQARN